MKLGTRAAALICVLAPAAASGCNLIFSITSGVPGSTSTGSGGGGQGGHGGQGTTASSSGAGGADATLTIHPPAVTLLAQTTLTFTAEGAGLDGGAGLVWSVDEAGGGTITQQGAYTAPLADEVVHVRATLGTRHGEALVTVKQAAMPVTLVSLGALSNATGHGSQSHLVYAEGTGEWWLFHDPAGSNMLATRHSADFVTWSDGMSLSLPQGNSSDGRNLSVAYRRIQNGPTLRDVVHLTQGYGVAPGFGRYHVRATVSAGQIALGTPRDINQGASWLPDGSATLILPSGLVIDSTGYQSTPSTPVLSPCGAGDVDLYTSELLDDGSTALDDLGFPMIPQVIWCVPNTVNARQLLAVGDLAVQLYVDGTDGQTPAELLASFRSPAGQWTPIEPSGGPVVAPLGVFNVSGESFDLDDWTGVVFRGEVHVVRRVTGTTRFEYRVVDVTAGSTSPGPAIPSEPTLLGSGLVLVPYGDGLVLLALDANAGSNVVYTAFDGSAWSPWATLCNLGGSGSWLSGFAPAPSAGTKPAVIWTTPAGTSYAIGGALLP